MKLGRKFIFGIVGFICISITSIFLKYDGETYIKLVGFITALFMIGQTVVDSIKKGGNGNG